MLGRNRGRPPKTEDQRITENGLLISQWDKIRDEAKSRNVPAAWMLRSIVDWYFSALETSREAAEKTVSK